MIIQGEDFKFIPIKPECPLFDVELLFTVNKGKSNERQEFKNAAYGISLSHAIRMVISNRISNKHDTIDLRSYIKEYREAIEGLKKFCYEEMND